MLLIVALVLLILWLTGNLFLPAVGSLIHVLLLVILVCLVLEFVPRLRGPRD